LTLLVVSTGPRIARGPAALEPAGPVPSISANHRRYAAMDRVLWAKPGAVRSHWFAAAACVTHPYRGLGTLDGVLGRLAFTPAQSDFLRSVHAGLFVVNSGWFDDLRAGRLPPGFEGVRPARLDHALVDAEQRAFTRLAHHYFGGDRAHLDRFTQALNARFRQSMVLRSRLLAPPLSEALRRLRRHECFDIGSEAHRCRIGHHLVDRIARQRDAAGDAASSPTRRANCAASNGACTFTSLSK
jgi:hypothetical protein